MDDDIFFMKKDKELEKLRLKKINNFERLYQQKQKGYMDFYDEKRNIEIINLFYGYLFGLEMVNDEIMNEFVECIKNEKYDKLIYIVRNRIDKSKILQEMKK